ncbi:hypothetical protein JZ751_018530 [Albula glossodonta]|uniref:Transmembrane protein 26 n=1 Tax=Albula glossodonta TaxID=121402 RepID=A0A8T2NWG3_9TELE|nr:hypothetical protein JZ751_018530 [Albula glossodonta]
MLIKFVCALLTRLLFIILSLIGVYRVKHVKNENLFWLLSILCIPLVVEMIVTLTRRQGKGYKWVSPAILLFLVSIIPTMWILELQHQEDKSEEQRNKATGKLMSGVCSEFWILGLHQALLILLILGKWVLPRGGGVTRDELSQLLLIFVGTAADILEFTSETLSDIKEEDTKFVYIILVVWTWSMLQFPLHLAVVSSNPEDHSQASVIVRRSTDIWGIVESLLFQDGPFLAVRLAVIIHHHVFNQMMAFFAIKNFLVVVLNLYRLGIICHDSRTTSQIPADVELENFK